MVDLRPPPRIRDLVSVRIRDRHPGEETVTPLELSYRGVCGYGSTFDYAG